MQHAYEHPITVEPVTLEGAHVRLEPLTMAHLEPLIASGATDPTLTQWFGSPITNVDELRAYIDAGLRERARGESVPFATIDRATGKTVGATRYMNIDRANHKLEIGFTFVCKPWQRSAVNTGAKYLMLRHAFETCGCMRVELKTDALNAQSRNAMLRIGAQFEGIFRNHTITASGRIRHNAWFAFTDDDWPQARARLEAMMADRSA